MYEEDFWKCSTNSISWKSYVHIMTHRYDMMTDCWNLDPHDRPSILDLKRALENITSCVLRQVWRLKACINLYYKVFIFSIDVGYFNILINSIYRSVIWATWDLALSNPFSKWWMKTRKDIWSLTIMITIWKIMLTLEIYCLVYLTPTINTLSLLSQQAFWKFQFT